MSKYRDYEEFDYRNCRSNKDCTCGGHNTNNHKKNLNHNSTKRKLKIKEARKLKYKMLDSI